MKLYGVVAVAMLVLLLFAQLSEARVKKAKKMAAFANDKPLPCATDDDCPYVKCQTATCVEGLCTSAKIVCPAAADPCSYSLGCDLATDVCRYSQLTCDDSNPCTADQCVRNNTEHSYCVHTPLVGCDNSAVHAVSFRVENANHLSVRTHSPTLVEFCQTSTLVGVDSSVVIGFDPYVPCKLHERSTCDNKPSVVATPSVILFANTYEDPRCSADKDSQAMVIEEVTRGLFWSIDSDATFTMLPMQDGYQIHGYLADEVNPGLLLRADIVLRPNDAHVPLRELDEQCYDSAGIDTTMWSLFDVASGTLTAAHDTQYMGLVYRITGGVAQTGHGASGRNTEWGMYMSVDLELASQAHDKELGLDIMQTKAVLRSNLEQHAAQPIDFCSLFTEPRQETFNGWRPTYNSPMHAVTYCRNFTSDELFKCRSFDNKYASLFKAISDDEEVKFAGTVYQTTLQPRGECSVWTGDSCGERIVSSTSYNITVVLNGTGVHRVDIVHSDFEFDIRWLENRWTCCGNDDSGNLRVFVETTITGENRRLMHPRVNFADETGHPLVFEDEDAPNCDSAYTDKCVQKWTLRSYGGDGVLDFSGIKPLLWDIFERQSIIAHVTATMTLRARHVGSQIHLDDGRVAGQLTFYSDRSLHTRFDANKAPDGTSLYGTICLDRHRHLDIVVNEVAMCYSQKRDLGDGECDQRVVLYSRTNLAAVANASIHAFEFITNPPSGTHCAGFSFLTRAYSKHAQVMHVDYSVQESTGDGGIIELWHDDDDADDDDHHHHIISYPYSSYCIPPRTFDWDHYHCHDRHSDDDDVLVFGMVFFGIVAFFIVGCVLTTQAKRKKSKYKKKSPQPSDSTSSDEDASITQSRRTVRGQFKYM